MKHALLVLLVMSAASSCERATTSGPGGATRADSLQIAQMIAERERTMIDKELGPALEQFADDATWINSQGYYFQGREVIRDFHEMLVAKSDYHYEAGEPRIRVTDAENAIAYYSWKMYWLGGESGTDTTMKEIGLMTLSAQKRDGVWRWIAVTNQHTPWFYESVEPVVIE